MVGQPAEYSASPAGATASPDHSADSNHCAPGPDHPGSGPHAAVWCPRHHACSGQRAAEEPLPEHDPPPAQSLHAAHLVALSAPLETVLPGAGIGVEAGAGRGGSGPATASMGRRSWLVVWSRSRSPGGSPLSALCGTSLPAFSPSAQPAA
ncbi:MAG: hypothetical protein P8R54_09855 [Myxococcota bacterium]|nr:hypothetical protein [Myxococcota bacterium]